MKIQGFLPRQVGLSFPKGQCEPEARKQINCHPGLRQESAVAVPAAVAVPEEVIAAAVAAEVAAVAAPDEVIAAAVAAAVPDAVAAAVVAAAAVPGTVAAAAVPGAIVAAAVAAAAAPIYSL